MLTIQQKLERDKFKQNVWQAFSEIYAESETYKTFSSIFVDDCLFLIVYNLQSGNGMIKRTWNHIDYSDMDFRERMGTVILKLKKVFEANGINLTTPWTYDSEDNDCADFSLSF